MLVTTRSRTSESSGRGGLVDKLQEGPLSELPMSAIPPNLVGPILQTPLAQGQISAARDNEEAQRAAGDRRQSGAITEADSTVETTDSDTAVYTDSEGAGSQGRAFASPQEETPEPDPTPRGPDEDTGRHIDLEA